MAKIEETDPNQKVLLVKAASGQVEDIVDVQSNAGVSYFKIDGAGNVIFTGGGGDVHGAASSTDNTLVRMDGGTGKQIQGSLASVDDNGAMNIPTGQTYNINNTPHTHAGSGGDVVGPASATDNAIARFDATTGKLVQTSLASVDDSGGMNIPTGQTYNINSSPHTHALAAHALTSGTHAESGLTSGHLLKATGTTTFGFSAGAAGDVALGNVTNNAQVKKIGSSTDNQVMRWDGTTGDTPQSCLMTVDDSGTPNIPTGQT